MQKVVQHRPQGVEFTNHPTIINKARVHEIPKPDLVNPNQP